MRLKLWQLSSGEILVIGILAANAAGQDDNLAIPKNASPAKTVASLRDQRQHLADQIAELQEADQESKDSQQSSRIDQLQAIDAVYAQHQAQLERREELAKAVKEAEKQSASLDEFDPNEPKPYSFLLLEGLKDELLVEKDRQTAIEAEAKSAKQLLQAAHHELDASPNARDEKANGGGAASSRGEAPLEKPTQEPSGVARAKVALRESEVDVINLRRKLCLSRQEQLTGKIAVVEKDVKFTAQDRDRQLQRLAEVEAALKRQRRAAEDGLQKIDSQKQADLKELSEQKSSQRLVDAATDAWRATAEAYQSQIVLLDQRIDSLRDLRQFWKRRYDLASATVESQKVEQWTEDLKEFGDQLKDISASVRHRIDAVRDDQTATARAASSESDDASRKWSDLKLARLDELREACVATLDDIKSTERMLDRFLHELKTRLREKPVSWTASIRESLASWFGYEVAEGEEEEAVTVGQLLMLVVYIAAGAVVAYFLSRAAGRFVFQRLGFHRGTVTALKSMMFYTLCIAFGVVAFQLLHVPMTAFAFVGGAVAIAAGFGGQDIMNNFMSGVILLAEQPIRVGDVVELEGVQGVVLHIGLRSTRLQTQSNHELIVPNHTLLDSSVTNLTLSDNIVQTFVAIGVERDVDVQKAKQDMLEVAFSHPLVLKSPRPVVVMTEVDTYWITFQIHIWLQYSNYIHIAMVQSQVLETISDLFRPPPQSASADGEDSEHPPATKDGSMADLQKMGRAMITRQMKQLGGR